MSDREVNNSISGSIVFGDVIQAGALGQPHDVFAGADEWVVRAVGSTVWTHVPAERDPGGFRHHVHHCVRRLVELRDGVEPRLTADPWHDPGFALRFLERVEWLVGEPDPDTHLDLYPAEAALLVLLPFLHQVHGSELVAEAAGADTARVLLEQAEGHDFLLKRARLRPDSEPSIGWWLSHRRMARGDDFGAPGRVRDLLHRIGAAAIGEALSTHRVVSLLDGLRRGREVCDSEFLDSLPSDDRVRGPGHQRVRDQRLCLITALAHGAAIGIADLPEVVPAHLGIPHPVEPRALRRTLDEMSWGGSHDLPVLRAQCHHEAVIEGLREHTARLDDFLHAVHRVARERITQPMPALPTRLSAAGVVPADGAFTGWARFRLDEHRIRDLLMGVQLYKDEELAIRELYQNALDACRYRAARTEYLDRTGPAKYSYDGRIRFTQDVDEDGRHYLECADNGIGMGEAELRGVFSNAGARFTRQADFRHERGAWDRLDPPVRLYPNSRFGIGVLSYFMLADEVRVTTCRMGRDGLPGPLLEVGIHGPDHLFRIVERAERGDEPGTRVRLYLRDDGLSSIEVLRRLLAIAEFATSVHHGEHVERWAPGQLKIRRGANETFGLTAHGATVAWTEAPAGARVIWCQYGGALLVDGLVVHPSVRAGVFAQSSAGLVGAVVDLSGPFAPKRLSVDRTEVLDDVAPVVEDLLRRAVGALVADEAVLDFSYLCRVAAGSVQLADMITRTCVRGRHELILADRAVDMARAGCFPADVGILRSLQFSNLLTEQGAPWTGVRGGLADHVLLWRLLAHAPNPALDRLVELCPELDVAAPVRPALPSDQVVLATMGGPTTGTWRLFPISTEALRAEVTSAGLGMTEAELEQAMRALGVDRVPDPPDLGTVLDSVVSEVEDEYKPAYLLVDAAENGSEVEAAAARARQEGYVVAEDVVAIAAEAAADGDDVLLAIDGDRESHGWIDLDEAVPPGHLARITAARGIPASQAVRKLRRLGLVADAAGVPAEPDEITMSLLSRYWTGSGSWREPGARVSLTEVMEAAITHDLPLAETHRRLAELGFDVPEAFPADARVDDRLLFPVDEGTGEVLEPTDVVRYGDVIASASRNGLPIAEVVKRLNYYGRGGD
ncbi:wHTH domain-containing protein [Saccharothrix stipae]